MTKSTRDSSCDQVAKTLLQEHTGSETTLNTVKGWLSKCDEGHSKSHACVVKMRALNYPTVPTRLIDVHGHGSKTWSLIETKKNQSFSKYVALSHRWTDDTPRLLRDNCISFQTGQHDKDVPRNYQDVFVLCRKLDIRYVWIDSLCIVQDSADDFLREASTMTEVYANAFCTFSICWESPDGFLRPRDTRTIPRDGPFSSTRKCFLDRYVFVQDQNELLMAIGQAPVNKRGWVFQEQLLSSRILYVGNDQFYWECAGGQFCETDPDELFERGADHKRENAVVSQHGRYHAWQRLVILFMRLGLSFERDRLLAISGIARFLFSLEETSPLESSHPDFEESIERKFGQTAEYLAGLQKVHWIQDILWYPDLGGSEPSKYLPSEHKTPGPESFKRCPDDIVPSWSWAACPGPMKWTVLNFNGPPIGEFPRFDGGSLACLRNSHFEPLGSDIYGLPRSASLDISCLLIQAKYLELEGPKDVKKSLEKSVDQTTDGCFNWYTDGFLLPLPYPRLHSDERSVITVPIEPCDNFIATCFVMPLLGGIYHHAVSIRGLVVQERPQADRKTREFVRIGSFTRYYDIEDPIKNRETMAIMNAFLKNLPINGDDFERKLRECAQGWREKQRLGIESENSITLKAEWTTIRLV
ncbi:hypothetical protein SNK04_002621 [Fusarium graminearum]